MSRIITSLSAAALTLAALAPSLARADETGTAHNVKTVGALTLATRGLATSPADVLRQGGLAVAGTADWTKAAAERATVASVDGAGSIGALQVETFGLATGPSDVRRQGGAMTASAVRWVSAPAGE